MPHLDRYEEEGMDEEVEEVPMEEQLAAVRAAEEELDRRQAGGKRRRLPQAFDGGWVRGESSVAWARGTTWGGVGCVCLCASGEGRRVRLEGQGARGVAFTAVLLGGRDCRWLRGDAAVVQLRRLIMEQLTA